MRPKDFQRADHHLSHRSEHDNFVQPNKSLLVPEPSARIRMIRPPISPYRTAPFWVAPSDLRFPSQTLPSCPTPLFSASCHVRSPSLDAAQEIALGRTGDSNEYLFAWRGMLPSRASTTRAIRFCETVDEVHRSFPSRGYSSGVLGVTLTTPHPRHTRPEVWPEVLEQSS
jgi:hypothetical protein